MHRILSFFVKRLPRRTIYLNGEVYLHRYYLFGRMPEKHYPGAKERLGRLPSFYLHHFLLPDMDRALHNHPWRWAFAWILAAGYDEVRLVQGDRQKRTRRPLSFNFFWPGTFHRIDRLRAPNVWTLFVTGSLYQPWGYLRDSDDSFIPARDG